ncbi:MAG: GPP34 family phosphoprotein [Bacteroidales bacterium]|nr:GPP34 family phosphoprotein [Bacteroidales bacterium]
MNPFFLNIPEEVYLLSINENGEQHPNFRNKKFDIIMSSALLMEMAERHIIDTDLTNIIPDKLEKTGEEIVDTVIDEIITFNGKRSIIDWITHISIHGQYFRDEIITSLVRKGVLKIQDKKTLWFFSSRKYPMQNNQEVKEVRSRLRELIFSDEIPEVRDLILLSILYHGQLLDTVVTTSEKIKYSDRISQISKMDFIGQTITQAMDEFSLGDLIAEKITELLQGKSAEEKLHDHILSLIEKYRIYDESQLPDWLRKGTEQYKKTLEYVEEVGTAEITFNPRTRKYSKLNYSYYSYTGGGGM